MYYYCARVCHQEFECIYCLSVNRKTNANACRCFATQFLKLTHKHLRLPFTLQILGQNILQSNRAVVSASGIRKLATSELR